MIGFATLDRNGRNGTNGGAGGPTVVVSSFQALVDAVADHNPRVVQISGTITPSSGVQMIKVGSNKTIVGVGATAKLSGVGFDVSGWTAAIAASTGSAQCEPAYANAFTHVQNVIIRNITFENYADDGINIGCYSHHVWVDHNTFLPGKDGALDIKRGADWVTVSWNHFVATTKTSLVGHDDGNGAQDRGRLHVTYHHNWFDRTDQRGPRVRYGQVHVMNNYDTLNTDYVIGKGVECDIHADGNYVDGADAVTDEYGGSKMTWDATNIVVNVGPSDQPVANGTAFKPSTYYSYTLESAASIPTSVGQGAGAGKIVP